MPLRLFEPPLESVRNRYVSFGTLYAGGMKTTTKTADQVRVPKVAPGEAFIITRHGEPISAVVNIEDYMLLERLAAAIRATRSAPLRPGAAALEAEREDNDEQFTPAELDSLERGRQ